MAALSWPKDVRMMCFLLPYTDMYTIFVTWSSHGRHMVVTWLSHGCHMPILTDSTDAGVLKAGQFGEYYTPLCSITPLVPTCCASPLPPSPQHSLHHHHAVRAASLHLQGVLATHAKDSPALLADLGVGCNDGDARVRTAALKALVGARCTLITCIVVVYCQWIVSIKSHVSNG